MTAPDELSEDLQRVLRDPSLRLPDDLVDLDAVHRTVRSRQHRRGTVAAVSALAVVAVVGLAATRPWQGDVDQQPVATGSGLPSVSPTGPAPSIHSTPPPQAVTLTGPVSGVTAISAQQWWVLTGSTQRCPAGACPTALYATTDAGATFHLVSRSTDSAGVPAGTTQVRFLTDSLAWALRPAAAAGEQLWESVDGGATWSLPSYTPHVQMTALEAGGGHGWVLVQDGRQVGVVELVPGLMENPQGIHWLGNSNGVAPALTVSDGDALVLWFTDAGSRTARVSADQQTFLPANPCSPDLGVGSISATTGGIAVSCHTGTADQPYVSVDGARSWSPLGMFGNQEAQRFVVGSIDGGLTAVGGQDGTITLAEPTGTGTPTKPRHTEVTNTEPWTHLGFTDPQHGFGITAGGVLFRTSDGGLSWHRSS